MSDVVRLRLLVAYDGTTFHGFAEQRDVRTVAGEMRIAMERVFGEVQDFTCAGRTDTGVHGWGQVVHADVRRERVTDLARTQRGLNKQLSPSIVIREMSVVDGGFDARFSAVARRYRYTVMNTPVANPFVANTAWWVPEPLDVDAMNAACETLVGEHDFSTFCRRPKAEEPVSLVRRLHYARWTKIVDELRFDIQGNAFCHQMVRALTGMLTEIGRGRRGIEDMKTALDAMDRAAGAPLAPPQGLCLQEVVYPQTHARDWNVVSGKLGMLVQELSVWAAAVLVPVESGDGLRVVARHALPDDWGQSVNRFDSGSMNAQVFCTHREVVQNNIDIDTPPSGETTTRHRMTASVGIPVAGLGTLEIIADDEGRVLGEPELETMRKFVVAVLN